MNIRSSIVNYCSDEFDDVAFGNELADVFIESMNSYITQSVSIVQGQGYETDQVQRLHVLFHKAKGELMTHELLSYYQCVSELCEKTRHITEITPEIIQLVYSTQELHEKTIKVIE